MQLDSNSCFCSVTATHKSNLCLNGSILICCCLLNCHKRTCLVLTALDNLVKKRTICLHLLNNFLPFCLLKNGNSFVCISGLLRISSIALLYRHIENKLGNWDEQLNKKIIFTLCQQHILEQFRNLDRQKNNLSYFKFNTFFFFLTYFL